MAIPAANVEDIKGFQGASASLRRPPWQRYAIAIAITALVTFIRYALDPVLTDNSIFTFYFASVILAAWYCGLGPSILNVALGAAIASFYFAEPRGSFAISGLRHRLGLVIFCAISSYLAYLIHWLNRDIARRKQVESELRASQKQLELHQIELAHMSRLSIMGEMVASLAHELNQPLHAAKNYARGCIRRMLKTPHQDAELLEALERMANETDRAAEILRRVRDFVQKTGPCVSAISLNELVQDAVMINSLEIKQTRATIVCDLAPDVAPVMADPIQIEQVVVNLARNGLESMSEVAGRAARIENRHAALRCADGGSLRARSRHAESANRKCTRSSSLSSPRSRRGWAWGWRSAARSSNRTRAAFGSAPMKIADARSISPFPWPRKP